MKFDKLFAKPSVVPLLHLRDPKLWDIKLPLSTARLDKHKNWLDSADADKLLAWCAVSVNIRCLELLRFICIDPSLNMYIQCIKDEVYENHPIHGNITSMVSSFEVVSPGDNDALEFSDIEESHKDLNSVLGDDKRSTRYRFQKLTVETVQKAIQRFDSNFKVKNDDTLTHLLQVYLKYLSDKLPSDNNEEKLEEYIKLYMGGFERGVKEGWWGADYLKSRTHWDQFEQIHREMLLRLYITINDCQVSRIIFHDLDGAGRCMALSYITTGLMPKGIQTEYFQDISVKGLSSKSFKDFPRDRLPQVLDCLLLPECEDFNTDVAAKALIYSHSLQESNYKGGKHDITNVMTEMFRLMDKSLTGSRKYLCQLLSVNMLRPSSNVLKGCSNDVDLNAEVIREYKNILTLVGYSTERAEELAQSVYTDKYSMLERVISGWILFTIFPQLCNAAAKLPEPFKQIAMQSGFESKLLEGAAQNEQVITHLLLGVNDVGSSEFLVRACPFTIFDTTRGIIQKRRKVLDPLFKPKEQTYNNQNYQQRKDAELKISDLTVKVTWLLIWAFLDSETMKQMKAFLRKEPTEGGAVAVPQRSPGTPAQSVKYVMNGFYSVLEQCTSLIYVVEKAYSQCHKRQDRFWSNQPVQLALVRSAFIEGTKVCAKFGCDPAIQDEMKEYISKLNRMIIKKHKVEFNCRCNEYGRSCCLCVAPFGHLTTFLFVMFSYYVAEYPELTGDRSKHKSLKVLECCKLREENDKRVNQVLRSTMCAIPSPAEFFQRVQVSQAYLFSDFFQDKEKIESGLQNLISAPEIVKRFNHVCNEFCMENKQVQANIQQFVEPEQDSKALTQDEANAGGEEENELELGTADATAGDGEVVKDDEENGNGEEADDEAEESTGGSDQMEDDGSQEPDNNKQVKTPRRKRRTPGTKELRSKKKKRRLPKTSSTKTIADEFMKQVDLSSFTPRPPHQGKHVLWTGKGKQFAVVSPPGDDSHNETTPKPSAAVAPNDDSHDRSNIVNGSAMSSDSETPAKVLVFPQKNEVLSWKLLRFIQSWSKDLKELAESEYEAVMDELRKREKCLLCKNDLEERMERMQLDNAEESINNLDNADKVILIQGVCRSCSDRCSHKYSGGQTECEEESELGFLNNGDYDDDMSSVLSFEDEGGTTSFAQAFSHAEKNSSSNSNLLCTYCDASIDDSTETERIGECGELGCKNRFHIECEKKEKDEKNTVSNEMKWALLGYSYCKPCRNSHAETIQNEQETDQATNLVSLPECDFSLDHQLTLKENDPPYRKIRDKESPKNCSTSTSTTCCSCQANVNDGEGIVCCKCQRACHKNISCANLLEHLKGDKFEIDGDIVEGSHICSVCLELPDSPVKFKGSSMV
jgi:hypothetical protein